MPQKIKKDFRFWLNIITLGALVFLIVVSWDQIREAFSNLDSLNVSALLLMIPVQLVGYYAVARLYRDFFIAHGEKIRLKTMFKIGLELNFVNHVFPSGGVSGFSYLSIRLKKFGISTSKSTLAQILRFALTFLSFLVLVLFGMFALAIGHNANALLVLLSSAIVFTTIFGTGVGIFIISKSSRIKSFVSWLPKALNTLFRTFHISKREIIDINNVEATLEDLHQDYVVLRQDMPLIKKLLAWAFLLNVTEIVTVYLVYVAFGQLVNPGAVIIAYAVANFAGLIAVLPGGVGIYEGLMTATLASAGVNKGLALSATVIYRVLQMTVFLPIGYYYYNRALKHNSDLRHEQEDASHIDS
jgi:uncharacterized protein (TIRG00374 family)